MTEIAIPRSLREVTKPGVEAPVIRVIKIPLRHRISDFVSDCFIDRVNSGVPAGLFIGFVVGVLALEAATELGIISNPNSMPTPPVYSPKALVIASTK